MHISYNSCARQEIYIIWRTPKHELAPTRNTRTGLEGIDVTNLLGVITKSAILDDSVEDACQHFRKR